MPEIKANYGVAQKTTNTTSTVNKPKKPTDNKLSETLAGDKTYADALKALDISRKNSEELKKIEEEMFVKVYRERNGKVQQIEMPREIYESLMAIAQEQAMIEKELNRRMKTQKEKDQEFEAKIRSVKKLP